MTEKRVKRLKMSSYFGRSDVSDTISRTKYPSTADTLAHYS